MENSSNSQIIKVDWLDRWQVYHRLQALGIDCLCQANQPLIVESTNPQAAIQIWSVTKQFAANRRELIDWLERCWQIKSHK